MHARSFERLRSRGVNPCAAHLAEPALRQGLEVREAGELAPPRALVAANLGKYNQGIKCLALVLYL